MVCPLFPQADGWQRDFDARGAGRFVVGAGRGKRRLQSLKMLRFFPARSIFAFLCLSFSMGAACARAERVDTNPLNREPDVQTAFQLFYNMDYDAAVPRFEKIRQEHSGNPMATAYLLDAVLFRELNRLDLLDTTFYANDGFLTGKHTVVEDPRVRDQVRDLSDAAIDEANAELKTNPNDVNALFARGWVRSMQAVYSAMMERAFAGGLRQALAARSDCDRVLQIDPGYVDAELVPGVYQYVVGSLNIAFKVLIGIVGIHGSKGAGLALLRDDGERGVITRVEARTSMMLFLRREAKYEAAIAMRKANGGGVSARLSVHSGGSQP